METWPWSSYTLTMGNLGRDTVLTPQENPFAPIKNS